MFMVAQSLSDRKFLAVSVVYYLLARERRNA